MNHRLRTPGESRGPACRNRRQLDRSRGIDEREPCGDWRFRHMIPAVARYACGSINQHGLRGRFRGNQLARGRRRHKRPDGDRAVELRGSAAAPRHRRNRALRRQHGRQPLHQDGGGSRGQHGNPRWSAPSCSACTGAPCSRKTRTCLPSNSPELATQSQRGLAAMHAGSASTRPCGGRQTGNG